MSGSVLSRWRMDVWMAGMWERPWALEFVLCYGGSRVSWP